MASHPIYQFYAELDDYKPKIWRRFQVSDDITAARLGYIIGRAVKSLPLGMGI